MKKEENEKEHEASDHSAKSYSKPTNRPTNGTPELLSLLTWQSVIVIITTSKGVHLNRLLLGFILCCKYLAQT